jgi:hypothetical protein
MNNKRFISTIEAMQLANVKRKETIVNWCKSDKYKHKGFGIGIKKGGRWLIDSYKLDFILKGDLKGLKTLLIEEARIHNDNAESYKLQLIQEIENKVNSLKTLIVKDEDAKN